MNKCLSSCSHNRSYQSILIFCLTWFFVYYNTKVSLLLKSLLILFGHNKALNLSHEKIMFPSQDIYVFVFFVKPNFIIYEVVIALLHIRSYTFHCLFRNLSSIKLKFSQILVYLLQPFSTYFVTIVKTGN